MKRLFLLSCFVLIGSVAKAQSSNITTLFQSNFKKAELMYNHLAYRNALELYLAVVEKDSSNYTARQRVADCHFRLGNIAEAEKWYGALAVAPDVPPKYKYQYAQVLSVQGKYADAQKWFADYVALTQDERARSKFEFIYYLSYYFRDSVLYDIKLEPFNSDQSDFAPQYYNDGLVFVSARDRDLFIKRQSASSLNDDEAMLNIFYAPKDATGEMDADFFYHKDLNSPYHDGPITFYGNGRKVAFSRNNLNGGKPVHHSGKVHLKLYFAELDDENKMVKIEPFPFNDDAYSTGHPWVSDDGNLLYFSSDRPGGEGGVDIYKSHKKEGKWTTPENLGATVNTMGDEFYPFMANDTSLYFSSNGHGGIGGLDIYVSRLQHHSFSIPENLGFPLNTSSDDFSLVMDRSGRKGVFSSNREGGVGYDDIYSFNVKSFFVVGKTIERGDSSKSVAQAKITLMDVTGDTIDSTYSDQEGYFHFDLDFDKEYKFSASKPGFSWIDSLRFSTYTRALGRDSLLIPLWGHSLFAKGSIYSNETQDKLPDVIVLLENMTDGRIDSVVTNPTGAYNFLLLPNKKYRVKAQKQGFIPRQFDLDTKGLTNGDLVNDFLLEEVFMEKVVLQFNFDKWNIKGPYHQQLDEIAAILKRNSKSHLHIGAYADSHGTQEYNLYLSNKRAQEVVSFFVSKGVDAKRITAVGFGEELLLNQCSNGVICNEEEHSKNRRAELKVQLWKED